MKKLTKITFAVICVCSTLFFGGCGGGGGGTPNPNAGFKMRTFAETPGVLFPTAAELHGDFLQANGNTTGTVRRLR